MKSLFNGVRLLLAKKDPAGQLAEIRARIRTTVTETERLDTEIARRAMGVMTGDAEAARIAEECKTEKQRLLDELVTLRHGEGQLAAEIAQKAAAERRAIAEALPAQLAADHAEMLKLDDEIKQLFATVAERTKRRRELGELAARRSGSLTLKHANDTLSARIKSAAARYFVISEGDHRSAANNVLGIVGGFVGEVAHWTLRQHDEPLFDEALAFFSTEEAARAAQQRQKDRGAATVISRIGATWTLTRHDQLFADRAAAENYVAATARGGRRQTILPRAPGFMVVDETIAEAVTALADAAD